MPIFSYPSEALAFIHQNNKMRMIQMRVPEGDTWKDYWIPEDPANGHYRAYQQWLSEGNEPRIIL